MHRFSINCLQTLSLSLLIAVTLLFGICTAGSDSNDSYASNESRLYKFLMDGYRPSIRPVIHENDSITVRISLNTVTIDDLDEKQQTFIFSGLFIYHWKDAILVWDPKNFGGVTEIRIPIVELWYPDIMIYNSKDAYYMPPTHHLAVVSNDGLVLWVPPVNIETRCYLDLSEFPFDEHMCSVIFASWMHSGSTINFTTSDEETKSIDSTESEIHSRWELKKIHVVRHAKKYECCPEEYIDITYTFTLKRRGTFFMHFFLGPSVVLCLIMPTIFLLPPGSGEKMFFGVGVVIADVLLLGELIDYVPAAHPNLPLSAKYFVGNIVMATLSLAFSAVFVGFWDKSNSRLSGPPAFFRLLILGPVASLFCVKKDDYLPMDETTGNRVLEINPEGEGEEASDPGAEPGIEKRRRLMNNYLRNVARSEWRQLAVVFDRLFLVIYFVILFILTLSFARFL